jgi:hypothetical protein
MVIPFFVNIFYIIFAFIYSRIIYKIIKSRVVQLLVFFLILILPFSDILIQKVIKNYYETFKIQAIVYDFPKKDDDGKIESLDLTQSPSNYFLQFVDKKDNFFNKRINSFLEIKLPQSESDNKFLRIKFDRKTIKSEIIKNPKAKYMINIQSQEKLFGLFNEIKYQLIDRQTKKVLVETISATFPYQKNNFRNKYLLWHIEKYDFFNLSAINEKDINEEDIIVKLLNAGHL